MRTYQKPAPDRLVPIDRLPQPLVVPARLHPLIRNREQVRSWAFDLRPWDPALSRLPGPDFSHPWRADPDFVLPKSPPTLLRQAGAGSYPWNPV